MTFPAVRSLAWKQSRIIGNPQDILRKAGY